MADILCPICNRINESTAERCWYCQADLQKESESSENGNTDWLKNLRGGIAPEDASQSAENGTENRPSDPVEEVPDWLARVRLRQQAEQEQSANVEPEKKPQSRASDFPDWLQDIKKGEKEEPPPTLEQPEQSAPIVPNPLISAEDEDEDWLRDLTAETSIAKPDDQENENILAESGTSIPEEETIPAESDVPIPEEEIPPIENFSKAESIPEIPSEVEVPVFGIEREEPAEEIPIEPVSEEPTEKQHIPKNSLDTQSELEEPPAIEEDIQDEMQQPETDRMSNFEQFEEIEKPPKKEQSETINEPSDTLPFPDSGVPDWLLQESISPQTPENPDEFPISNQPGQASGPLEKANLPTWLKAMRPVEAVAPIQENQTEPQDEIEEAGLLAGIEGTLHGRQMETQVKKPEVYTQSLIISKKQQENAALFQQLIEGGLDHDESEIPTGKKAPNVIIRAVVTLALLLAVILPMYSLSPVGIMPMLYPPEVVQSFSTIQSLTGDKPVLIATNFEAGLAGEMDWSSRSLIRHLMMRNVPIMILSLNSAGSAMVQQQVTQAGLLEPAYPLNDLVINLGYLPGNSLGLQELANNLRQAVPFTQDLKPAWLTPILQNTHSLSDFGTVIVFTDSSEVARTWAEQVKPALGATPMLMVVSAQAAPMVQPYYASGQVTGFISGMNGSLAYEQILAKSDSSTQRFGSFQAVLLLVACIVFLGGVWSLIQSSVTGPKKAKGI